MDLLDEIKNKVNKISTHPTIEGITAALRHIEVAERHLHRARMEQDEDLLNDVIYRTNQAFEGMLKEAYGILASKSNTKITSYQIEQHLLDEKLLTPRVLDLFKNYRQEWRNPSTHNHKLYFNDQEALLAIVNVSAFSNILLDQIIEAINLQYEQEKIEKAKSIIQAKINNHDSFSFVDQLIFILNLFSEEIKSDDSDLKSINELELIGRLQGFLSSLLPSIQLIREPKISLNERVFHPDIVIVRAGEKIVLELMRVNTVERKRTLVMGRRRLLYYLKAGNYESGILYIPPTASEQIMETLSKKNIHMIAPKKLVDMQRDEI